MTRQVLGLSEARKEMSGIFNRVALNGHVVEIRKRGINKAIAVVPIEMIDKKAQEPNLRNSLARVIAEHLLAGADDAFIEPQIDEFKTLPQGTLELFLRVSLPLSEPERTKLIQAAGEKIVSRLEKRFVLSQKIKEAQEQGLYEAAEHGTGMLNLQG